LTTAAEDGLIDLTTQHDKLSVTLHPPRYNEEKEKYTIEVHTADGHTQSFETTPPDSPRGLPMSIQKLKTVSKYQPLIDTILNLSNNRFDFAVYYEAVADGLGGNKRCKDLGWSTFGSYVEETAREGYVTVAKKESHRFIVAKVCQIFQGYR
jgi:hypothetical protein